MVKIEARPSTDLPSASCKLAVKKSIMQKVRFFCQFQNFGEIHIISRWMYLLPDATTNNNDNKQHYWSVLTVKSIQFFQAYYSIYKLDLREKQTILHPSSLRCEKPFCFITRLIFVGSNNSSTHPAPNGVIQVDNAISDLETTKRLVKVKIIGLCGRNRGHKEFSRHSHRYPNKKIKKYPKSKSHGCIYGNF